MKNGRCGQSSSLVSIIFSGSPSARDLAQQRLKQATREELLRLLGLTAGAAARAAAPSPVRIASVATRMFDWDAVFLALQEYKLLKAWSNLRLDRQRLIDFCTGSDAWYTLFIPQAELAINRFADVTKQQDILVQLLTEYTDRFYRALKAGYEGQFYDVAYMTDDHGSMLKLYQFEIDATDDGREYETKLKVLRDLVAAGKIGEASQWNAPHMVAISFARHLYYPLMAPDVIGNLPLKMRPLAFDAPSEVQFVRDLESFYSSSSAKKLLVGKSLYLLRNADARAKGTGIRLRVRWYVHALALRR